MIGRAQHGREQFQFSLDNYDTACYCKTVKKTLTTRHAAKLAGVSRLTLVRWVNLKRVQPSQVVRLNGVTAWFWTLDDVEKVRKHKAAHYWEGRGRQKGK